MREERVPGLSIYSLDDAGRVWTFAAPHYWRPATVEEWDGFCRETTGVGYPYRVNGSAAPQATFTAAA